MRDSESRDLGFPDQESYSVRKRRRHSKERGKGREPVTFQLLKTHYRTGKTSDLFKKTRDTKETFHAKMGTIKDRKHHGPNGNRGY